MLNLNDIMQNAHNGGGIAHLAEQFDITPQQAQAAVQAILPSLSIGLQQQMAGPGFGQSLSHFANRQNQAAFETPEAAQSDDTVASGTDVLNHLFGNEDVTGQVAQNAAQHTSLSADLLSQMMPVVAAMVMGGLFKAIAAKGGLGGIFGQAAAAPAPAAPHPAGGGGIGDILGQMTGQRAPAPAPAPASGGGIGDILGQLTGQRAAPQAAAAQAPGGGGGLGDILSQLAGGGQHGQTAQSAGGGGLADILGKLAGGQGGAGAGGGLADILGKLAGGQGGAGAGGGLSGILGKLAGSQGGQGAPAGGGGLGDLLGGLLGGAGGAHAQGGGITPAQIQMGLQTLNSMFGHGTTAAPGQQSGLESILGGLLGGGRR